MTDDNQTRRESDIVIAQLSERLASLSMRLESYTKDVHEILLRHEREIYGNNGHAGLKSSMSTLQDREVYRSKREFFIWSLIIAAIIAAVTALVLK
jgi:hypothetical protein